MAATGKKAKAARSADKQSDTAPSDAIALLESDHREVEGYFEQEQSNLRNYFQDSKKLLRQNTRPVVGVERHAERVSNPMSRRCGLNPDRHI